MKYGTGKLLTNQKKITYKEAEKEIEEKCRKIRTQRNLNRDASMREEFKKAAIEIEANAELKQKNLAGQLISQKKGKKSEKST